MSEDTTTIPISFRELQGESTNEVTPPGWNDLPEAERIRRNNLASSVIDKMFTTGELPEGEGWAADWTGGSLSYAGEDFVASGRRNGLRLSGRAGIPTRRMAR